MAQQTFNPSSDGDIENVLKSSWTNARDASSGTVNSPSTTMIPRGEFNGATYSCGHGYMTFDVTALSKSILLNSATIVVNVSATTAINAAHGTLHLVQSTQASPDSLVGNDFTARNFVDLANTIDGSTTGQKTFTLNATALAYLVTKLGSKATFCLLSDKDFTNTQPTGLGTVSVDSLENGTPGNRPLLTVNYSPKIGGMIL